jgi:hypothetical protein
MDVLLAIGLAGLTLSVLWPQKRAGRILRAERHLSERVVELGQALQDARAAVVCDADGDGVGEFPPLAQLQGPAMTGIEPVPGTAAHRLPGWYVQLLLPDRRLQPVAAGAPSVFVDGAEVGCLLIAWPEVRGETGMRAFCWTPADGLLKHTVDGYPYGGADEPPAPRRALLDRVGGELKPASQTGFAESRWVRPVPLPR